MKKIKWKGKSSDWAENLKESLLKSLIYRVITISLGMLVAFIITGSLAAALSLGIITETVQFINYFIYESVWTNFHDKRLKRKILEMKEVNIKFDFELIEEISYEFSKTDTFLKEIYDSIIRFFDKILQNKYLDEIHSTVLRDKTYFELKHENRSFN
ncbi:MAG: DUF2061 domain-containing protein [Promethearchaeota archaeon]|jgi:uncharacterized membrane protein